VAEQPTQLRTVMVRNVDTEVWAMFRAEAMRRRWDTAALLEHVIREWMADRNGSAPAEVA
jgi:hypothetical protein